MEYLSADKILVVDLTTSEVTEDELSDELVEQKIGGAAINKYLYEQYEADNPVVVGTGLLTGTLFPASGAAVMTAKSPVTGNLCHCPITLKVGLEIQFAGFDYIVIKGASDNPVFLWVHDGIADITDALDVWGKNTWETTDTWRKAMGDDLIQTMVIGKAGEAGSDLAQVCLNYWASGDRFGFGKLFGEKKLKGLAFRGMGLLEIADAEEFVDQALEILDDIREGDFIGKKGIGDIYAAMGQSGVNAWLEPLVHRHSACYNTPYATNTFVYLDEDPATLKETANEEPGFLITELYGLLGFKALGLSADDACRMLKICAKGGYDAAAVAHQAKAAGKTSMGDIESALADFSGAGPMHGKGVFSPWCPNQPLFSFFEEAEEDPGGWWERRQAVAYIFGIHPIFAVMSPELVEDDMLEMAGVGTELSIEPEKLNAAVAYLYK
ncbi:MAG: hypothetical protein HKM93_10995 [Desulfobacteraceae bacterium]|nr:hypothetical protein [Desulfobacteraceae bacterium]